MTKYSSISGAAKTIEVSKKAIKTWIDSGKIKSREIEVDGQINILIQHRELARFQNSESGTKLIRKWILSR